MPYKTQKGSPFPYGTQIFDDGINFSVFTVDKEPHLVLLNIDTHEVTEEIKLHKTGQIHHVFLEGAKAPMAYGYRTSLGKDVILMDPYSKALKTSNRWNDDKPYLPVSVILTQDFDWGDDKKPQIPQEELIIYEMHVRGFSQDPSSKTNFKGTFKGIIDQIPYLKQLGVNAVELMPVQEFNQNEYRLNNLYQYWGYSTVNFFAPMNRYASNDALGSSIQEFKEMVRALHQANIEVIVDVVLNHTAEGNERGPIQSFKGLAPEVYYLFNNQGEYINDSGCGNTVNCNHPVVIEFILDVLHYWAIEMHVDGFRFDLASIFYRGKEGYPLEYPPPVLTAISEDPILSSVKLISEPWDAAGLYQVGSFFCESPHWAEWNGQYRDIMRRFLKGDHGLEGKFASKFSGSQDLYGHNNRQPNNSINFITCHDGFSLRDLVSYNQKHNESNGENNRDGNNQNDSWNCGVEGPTEDPKIIALRERQMRNIHLALITSQGTPMLYMGDEVQHTKNGNNNTWCQDNALSWFPWELVEKNKPFLRFYSGLNEFRKKHRALQHTNFLTDDDVQWHGLKPEQPLWDHPDQFVACTLWDHENGEDLYIAFNASKNTVTATLPNVPAGKGWFCIANTSLTPPDDFCENPVQHKAKTIQMLGFSSVLLVCLNVIK